MEKIFSNLSLLPMPYILGIDQGTTQTTAVVVDENASFVDVNSIPLPAHFPRPGWVEQDPYDIVRTVKEAVAPLIEKYDITAVGFDNQGETFVVWDNETGEPLTPAIVWQDKRGVEVCEALASQVDNDSLRRKTGLILDSYFSAPKLRYAWEHDAHLKQAIDEGRARFGTTETWVIWNLSNRKLHITDPSTASRTLLFDVNRLEWDDELLALFGATRTLLPKIVPSAGYAGDLDFGDGKILPLHALLVDQQAALFGQACFKPGEMKCSFGTGSFLLMNIGREMRLSNHGLLTTMAWNWDKETAYALDGGIFVTGSAVQWLTESLGFLPNSSASAESALQSKDDQVVVVPALQGLAAPHWLSEARGAIFGLSRGSSPADIVRATLDGIAFRVYEVVNAMAQDAGKSPPHLKVDGGPSGNPYLMQFIADLLDLEVRVAAAREATAMGIANLAAHSALGTSLEDLSKAWKAEAVYTPRMKEEERVRKLSQWNHALEAVKRYTSSQVNR
ncbi:MAG: glycerol kinase GlpK [Chloroflexota bacterium]|nr:glycerol kinase GlpK [Chloroflexota bacterium]